MGNKKSLYHLKFKKQPVEGIGIELISFNGRIIYKTFSLTSGRFVIPRLVIEKKPEEIRFFDSESNTIWETNWTDKNIYNLPEGIDKLKSHKISARKKGKLLKEYHLNRLLKLILRYGSKTDDYEKYENAIEALKPPLNDWSDILETSAGVLDGDPYSIKRFKSILKGIRPKLFVGRSHTGFLPRRFDFSPLTTPRVCLMGNLEYQQLVAAVSLISHDSIAFETNLIQLQNSLAGLNTLERILNYSFPTSTRINPRESAIIGQNYIERLLIEIPGLTPWPPVPLPEPRPLPEDFIPEIDLCELFRQTCIPIPQDTTLNPSNSDNDGEYVINSITTLPATFGSEITIRGENFGPEVQFVKFPRCGGGALQQPPIFQSENEIRVIVPEKATDGLLSLGIQIGAIPFCTHLHPVYEQGTPAMFLSGSPTIDTLKINGNDSDCLITNQVSKIEWTACPPSAVVELSIDGNPWQIVQNIGDIDYIAPSVLGERIVSVRLRVAAFARTTEQEIRFRIAGSQPKITIEEVEFTQGIQTFFRNDGTPNNSLPLIANKDTIVRVYIDVDRNGFNNDILDITGRINVEPISLSIFPINSNNRITKGPFGQADRNFTNSTLNFHIPASACDRELTLNIAIVGDWQCEPQPIAERIEIINFREVPAIPIGVRRIRGRAGNAPSVEEALLNVRSAFTYLPSPITNISVINGVHDVGWMVGLAGGYDTNTGLWLLSRDVNSEHVFSGISLDGRIWVGLTFKFNRGIMAWPDSWTCISHVEGNGENVYSKTAHEIAHCLGFGHVKNSGDESCNSLRLFDVHCEDSQYEGPLLDIPFRFRTNTVGTPLNEVIQNARDLMGYEFNSSRFLNPDFWLRAMNQIDNRF